MLPSFSLPKYIRMAFYFPLLVVFTLVAAQGEPQHHDLRIGLQTQQTEVRLQGAIPVKIDAAGVKSLTLPENQVLIFRPADKGVQLLDDNGNTVLTATGPIQVKPDLDAKPAEAPQPGAPAPTPLIKLLGPTRHYDGKTDRPYRGYMEILPRTEGLTVVNVVDMEAYLLGVVSSEMSPRYPLEALKAQAIAARTYALKNLGRCASQGFDLDDTAACQVYGGYPSEDPRTSKAVQETANMVLIHNGALVDAVYSSTCGGYTESAEQAWGRAVPYLVGRPDFHEENAPIGAYPKSEQEWADFFKTARALHCLQPKFAKTEAFRWVKLITRKEIEAGLPEQYRVGTVMNITPLRRGKSGRIYALRLDGSDRSVTIEKELPIRKALGSLRSSAFSVDIYRDDNDVPVVFAFWGAGWGHGLGMCQVGAVGLADEGWTYDKILTHYYHGVNIETR
ncbi:MAG: SpoIID/LytB domain-containing protein [Armatimonadota bacterium]